MGDVLDKRIPPIKIGVVGLPMRGYGGHDERNPACLPPAFHPAPPVFRPAPAASLQAALLESVAMTTKARFLVVLGLLAVNAASAPGADPPKPAPGQPAIAPNAAFFLRDVMPLGHPAGLQRGAMPRCAVGQRRAAAFLVSAAPPKRTTRPSPSAAGHANRPHGAGQEPVALEDHHLDRAMAAASRSSQVLRSTSCCFPGSGRGRRTRTRGSPSWSP